MHQLWDRNEPKERVENLVYLLKKFRGTLNKMRASLENPRLYRYAKNPSGLKECAQIIHQIQDSARILTLFVDGAWNSNPDHTGLFWVQNIDDILQIGGTEMMKEIIKTDKDSAWNVVKIWLKDKVLGPCQSGENGLLGVWSQTSAWMTWEEAFEESKKRRRR